MGGMEVRVMTATLRIVYLLFVAFRTVKCDFCA